MLRIAVPNKGSLSAPAIDMLREAGYRQRRTDKDLTCTDEANSVQFFYLRPRDIATYVGSGDLALLLGFGAGLSYAATVVELP